MQIVRVAAIRLLQQFKTLNDSKEDIGPAGLIVI